MNESLLANCPECGTLLPSPVHALVGQNVLFVKCNACKKIYTILSCSDSVNIKLDRMGQDFSSCLRNYFPRTEKESVVANVFTQKLPEHSNGVFSLRHGQRALAVAVMRALESKSDLLADAGVGIGKSFAYLVPILHEGRGLFVISTSTLVLQEQLADDIRQLAKLLHRPEPEVIVSKGERNYICFMRLEQILSQEGIDQRLKDEARIVRKSLNRLQSSSNCNDIGSWERETAGALNVSPQLRKFVIVNQQVSSEHQHSDCNTCASRECVDIK